MSINFKKLKSSIENRRIREVISTGGDVITVYEPTVDDVQFVVEYQTEKASEMTDSTIFIDGVEIVKLFFPRFTDISGIEDLSNDELEAVIDEPSIAYLQVEQVIKGIIAEIFKMIVLSAKTQVAEFDMEVESERSQQAIFDLAFKDASKNMGLEELMQKIDLKDAALREVLEKSIENHQEVHQELQEGMGKQIDKRTILQASLENENVKKELEESNPHLKATNLLNQYKSNF